jgi:putative membrane protein
MIVADSTNFVRFVRGYWKYLVAVVVVLVAVEVANDYVNFDRRALSPTSIGLVVTALSIFLVFRVGEAYSRWWEARGHWGYILNDSRSFARQITNLVSDESAHTRLVYRHLAWINGLRHALRGEDDRESIAPFLTNDERATIEGAKNHATQLMQLQGRDFAELQAAGAIDPIGRWVLEETMSRLTNHQGGCEKIKATAFPDRVSYFSRITAWGLAVAIPAVVLESGNEIDLIDMFVTPFMMLAFLLTERLGADLKKPFENRVNDTPMTALCRTIEIDLRQQLGETDLPERLEPVDGVLM